MNDRPTRHDLFARAAAKMRADFEELKSVHHRGVKGGAAERVLGDFLNDHMPQRFRAEPGFIIDRQDRVTGHNDIIVYDALNCPRLRVSDTASYFPSDNVAVVVEVKSRLTRAQMDSAAEKVAEAKSLTKTPPPANNPVLGIYGNHETIGVLFAYTSALKKETALEHYKRVTNQHGMPNHIDIVIVLDRFLMCPFMHNAGQWAPMFVYTIPRVEGMLLSVGAITVPNTSLDAMMRFILAHLSLFWHRVDHPGFDWTKRPEDGLVQLAPYTAITLEQDPERRQVLTAEYEAKMYRALGQQPPPQA